MPETEYAYVCIACSTYIVYTMFMYVMYEGVSKCFRTDRMERELQMVKLSATSCSCISISWVSLVSFAAITLCIASQRVVIVDDGDFVID
jgi:hypothetical protein